MKEIIHIRLIASKPNAASSICLVGIIAGMIFQNMIIVIGFGIILFIEAAFGVYKKNKG